MVAKPPAQNMLLDESSCGKLALDVGILEVLDVGDDPAKHGEILLDGLLLLVGVVPDQGLRLVDRTNRVDIAFFDGTEQFIGCFEVLLFAHMNASKILNSNDQAREGFAFGAKN